MTSSILQTATRLLMPLLLLFALFLLLRGHNAPGGGFVAGLVVAAAFVLHVDRVRHRCQPPGAAGRSADCCSRIGLLVALISGLPAVLLGRPFMTALWTTVGAGRRRHRTRHTAALRHGGVPGRDWRRAHDRLHVGRRHGRPRDEMELVLAIVAGVAVRLRACT